LPSAQIKSPVIGGAFDIQTNKINNWLMRSCCGVWRQVLATVGVKVPTGPIRNHEIEQLCQLTAFQTFQSVFNILVLLRHLDPDPISAKHHLWITI
jgi:hypothetical protein